MTPSESSGPVPVTIPEVEQFVRERFGTSEAEPLAGDASVRQYFRVQRPDGGTVVVCWYPPAVRRQLDVALAVWRAIADDVPVPAILGHEGSIVIQQDAGDESLTKLIERDPRHAGEAIGRAVDLLASIHRTAPRAAGINPDFDSAKFLEELEMTIEYFVKRVAGVREAGALEEIREISSRLAVSLAEHPYLICHRDYHSDNIYILNNSYLVIDYQDMRMGPDTYDLASLLRDRGTVDAVGSAGEAELLARYVDMLGGGEEVFARYHEALLQRSLKILGTFARQVVERKRKHYVRYVSSALAAVRDCVAALPQYEALLRVFPVDYA